MTNDLSRLTVPQLRARCKAAGLPAYQRAGRRLRKADLIEQLRAARPGGRPRTVKTPPRDDLDDAGRALLLDFRTATVHAKALGISRAALLEADARTMHRILRDCATPADERHWRTKAVLRDQVAAAWA